jgi:hypothetical protein
MLNTHQITKKRLITTYKGAEPFRLTADYVREDNVDIANQDFSLFAENDLVLLEGQDNPNENGLYLFTDGALTTYYPEFFEKIDKIYAIDEKEGISSYVGFFGVGDPLNQLHHIHPGQGLIIITKLDAILPFDWYTYETNILPAINIDHNITKSNFANLLFSASDGMDDEYTVDLRFHDYRPVVLTSRISGSSDQQQYLLRVDLVSCPDPEYINVVNKVVLDRHELSLSGSPSKFVVSPEVLSNKFRGSLRPNDVVWVTNKDFGVEGLYLYDGYTDFHKLSNSDYIIRTKKYIIEESQKIINSIPEDFYVNYILNIGYPGHYDVYLVLENASSGTIVSEDHYCFHVKQITNLPTPTPTVTPTLPIHSVSFDDGSYLKVDNCESCAKIFVGASAFGLLSDANYYYQFEVFTKGESLPRDLDTDTGTSFEPREGFLSTGLSSEKFGTYVTTADKTRTIISVKLTNLDTGVSATSYLTLAVCDENYCAPEVTPTVTPTTTRVQYAPRPTPTPKVGS